MKLAIVIPVYLDADALPGLLERIFRLCDLHGHEAEIVLVEDGSWNDTWQRLLALRHAHAGRRILLLRLAANSGQQAATICGLMHCSADIAITLDADLQHPPEEIPRLLEDLTRRRLDLVYGIPVIRQHSLPRRAGSLLFRSLTLSIGRAGSDTSSFRAIRTSLVGGLPAQIRRPYLSIDAYMRAQTDRIGSIRVHHEARPHGSSTYTWRRLLVTALKELHYSGRSGFIYLVAGTAAVLLGSLGLLRESPVTLTSADVLSAANPLLLAGGAYLLALGAYCLHTDRRPAGRPLFTVAERIE